MRLSRESSASLILLATAAVLGAVVSYGGGAGRVDYGTTLVIYKLLSSDAVLYYVMYVITHTASVLAIGAYLAVLLIYLGLRSGRGDARRKYLILTIVALIVADVLVGAMKWILKLPRPPWGSYLGYTYPSGHAARASALALMVPKVVGGSASRYLGILMWLWVGLVCFSRVVLGAHYILDTVGGVMVGAASSLFVEWAYDFLRRSVVVVNEAKEVRRG